MEKTIKFLTTVNLQIEFWELKQQRCVRFGFVRENSGLDSIIVMAIILIDFNLVISAFFWILIGPFYLFS